MALIGKKSHEAEDLVAKNQTSEANGATAKKPLFKRVWFWVVVVIVLAAIGGTSAGGSGTAASSSASSAPSAASASAPQREIDPHTTEGTKYEDKYTVTSELTSDGWASYVEGILVNKTNKKYNYIQIEFTLYDEDGNNIGSAFDNASNLGAGESWKFKASCLTTDTIGSYKFADISAY